jgi:CheY-like chemotaxis protein
MKTFVANEVLVVSASAEAGDQLADLLRQDSWTVRPAQSCREALDHLSIHGTPVVICDSSLPDGNWKDLLGIIIDSGRIDRRVEALHHLRRPACSSDSLSPELEGQRETGRLPAGGLSRKERFGAEASLWPLLHVVMESQAAGGTFDLNRGSQRHRL